jgi:phosphoribosylformylglycinamidine synthase subunit PurQ / glutaminase
MYKFGVIVFPGSNCDYDSYHVIKHLMGQSCEFVWHEDVNLSGFDCIIIPGGFSYGDYLRTGAIASLSPIMDSVEKFASRGRPVLGTCNGFQILVEAGLLPGVLLRNSSLMFVCKWVNIKVENTKTAFTGKLKEGDVLRIPVAHGEGSYYCTADVLKSLEENSQIVFRYCDEEGRVTPESNPNGSIENIAGICNKSGNVLGMMPHPERCSESILGGSDGRFIFESVISWLGLGRKTKSKA